MNHFEIPVNDPQETNKVKKNGYVAFYKGGRKVVYAASSYAAQKLAAAEFGVKESMAYKVAVVLAEKDGKEVTHVADF